MTSKTLLAIGAMFGLSAAVLLLRDHHMRLFSGLEGFSRREAYSLLDSLPALSPGLSELEAFKLTADAAAKTNADRSIWLSDSLHAVTLEFFSGRSRVDSTLFYLWTSDSVLETRTLRNARHLTWRIPYERRVAEWTEVVGVYVSRPPFLNVRFADSAPSVFDKVEGKTLHIVRRRYRNHEEKPVPPDTSYRAEVAGELQVLAKGDALALVNPSARTVEVRIIRITEKRWDLCRVPARTTRIYRTLLKDLEGPVLAYTSPGKAHSVLVKRKEVLPSYFWMDRPTRR